MHLDFDLDLLRLLAAVVEGKSFAAASRTLGISRSTVRRRLAALEDEVGVPLIRREGDRAVPTRVGEALARGARSVLAEAAALIKEASGGAGEPNGLVRIAMPPGESPYLGALALQAVRKRWPRLQLSAINAAVPHALLVEQADLALTFAEPAPDGPWAALDLFALEHQLYASATYLRRHGTPARLEDLADHDLLVWEPPEGGATHLTERGGGPIPLPTLPVFHSNNIHSLRQMALLGAGIAYFPDGGFSAPGEPGDGLVPVLPDRVGARRWVRLLLPNAYRDIPRAKALADALVGLMSRVRAAP